MNLILGIDPGVKSAVSLFVNGIIKAVDYVEPKEIGITVKIELKYRKLADAITGRYAFIERPYLNLNVQTLINQSIIVGRWLEELENLDFKVTQVPPENWYEAVCRGFKRDKRAERKQKSLFFAGTITGLKLTDHNLADAVCIGQYGVGQVNQLKLRQ